MEEQLTNPLIHSIHEQCIDRPDSIHRRIQKGRSVSTTGHFKLDWHPVAAAVAMMGSLLSQKGHSWNKGQKLMYRRAIQSARHPCCPTCGKPMNESAVIANGITHKSWYCERDQNF